MTYHSKHVGKAMTAIAAVVALSTPSFAQEVTAPPDTAVDTAVEPTTTTDSLAAEPAANETPVATETAVPPAPKPKVETRSAPAPRANTAARIPVRRTSAAAPAAAIAPAAGGEVPAPPPANPESLATAEPTTPPITEPTPASDAPDTLSELLSDDMLPITGAAALGLIALAGTGIAMRRRKRRREEEEFEARQEALAMLEAETSSQHEAPQPTLELTPADEVRAGPLFARPRPIHDPVPDKKAPVAGVPEDFDLSRFGPHVQAAYQGPTPDNPSVSLEYRLRRAAALDEADKDAKSPVEQY